MSMKDRVVTQFLRQNKILQDHGKLSLSHSKKLDAHDKRMEKKDQEFTMLNHWVMRLERKVEEHAKVLGLK